jgi:hypothetical protein
MLSVNDRQPVFDREGLRRFMEGASRFHAFVKNVSLCLLLPNVGTE